MTPQEAAQLIQVVQVCWPTWKPGQVTDEVLVGTWAVMLRDVDYNVAARAVRQLAMENEFPVGPGQVLAAATEITANDSGQGVPDLDRAFAQLTEAVRRHGYVDPEGARDAVHPAVWGAIEGLGGWQQVCRSENAVALRAHFNQVYATSATRATRELGDNLPALSAARDLASRMALPEAADDPLLR